MAEVLIVSSLILLITNIASGQFLQKYHIKRRNITLIEDAEALGGHLEYQPGEREINDILMKAKLQELHEGFLKPSEFPPAQNFLNSKKDIEKSAVFSLIKRMPKGATLHAHSTAFVSDEYVFNNLTYRENLYICRDADGLRFHFFDKPNDDCEWKLLSELRERPKTAQLINEMIRKEISMYDPSTNKTQFEDGNAAWKKFENVFRTRSGLLKYKPVNEDYFYQGLQELYDDNVMYLEIRSGLGTVYDLNGREYSTAEVAQMYRNTAERFVRDNPKFFGVKLIYAPHKTDSETTLDAYMINVEELKEKLPDFIVGFDLVGHEDNSPTLLKWIDKIREISKDIHLFLHAGETDWNGMNVDENLIDAVLLNATRIGHGYALLKHPKVLKMIRRKKIAIEICPISNQVLHLVQDLRNHPASALFANDFPVVVSSDDPGLWGVKGLSYDFYEAFIGIMSAHSDIRAIKQLAINSLTYSALNGTEKAKAMFMWTDQWNEFIRSQNKQS